MDWGAEQIALAIAGALFLFGVVASLHPRCAMALTPRVPLPVAGGWLASHGEADVVAATATAQFTDPAWADRDASGSAAASDSPPGALCYVRTGGSGGARLHEGMVFPNGLVITPSEEALIVGETGTGRLLRFPVLGPGVLGDPTVWAELGEGAFPDGLCWDSEGRLIVAGTGTGTGSGNLFVISPAGDVLARIPMPDVDVTNVCFGGEDGRTLIVTEASLGRVSALRWPVPGLRMPASPSPW